LRQSVLTARLDYYFFARFRFAKIVS